jgi:transposase InsO family protein
VRKILDTTAPPNGRVPGCAWHSPHTPVACGDRLAQQIVEAFPWDTAPTYLVRDNDGAYGHAFTSRVRAMGIRDRPIAPRSPWQNPYVERLIGTLRRDCLDHFLIFGSDIYDRFYYNETRMHLGLRKDAPLGRAVQRSGTIVPIPILSGLHHRYARI